MSERSHDEHLEWCKTRARFYLERGDAINAVASMHSDLAKHPDWQRGKLLSLMTMVFATDPSLQNAQRIVEGYQ